VSKAIVKDLQIPIEFSFPVSDNQNLSEFLTNYNMLSNFKRIDILKKE
jgi:hypothetical protein